MLIRLPKFATQKTRCLLQTEHHRVEMFATGQAAEVDLGMRVIGADMHLGQTDHAHARVPQLGSDDFGELAADLLADPVPAQKTFVGRHLQSRRLTRDFRATS
jgi:hypothetical protein